MLSFILGPSGYGKTYTVISEIKALLDRNEGKKVFVIVPEQESVKMEAELLAVCGNRINADVEVINFSRLANRVFRESGGMTYEYIDTPGKDLMTAVILERLKSACPTFSGVSDDTGYIKLIREEMDTLRIRGFHASDIVRASDKLLEEDRGGTTLYSKLNDFATVFQTYEKTLKDNVSDTTDDIERLAQTLDDFDFFEGAYVYVDGFYDYTVPQYNVMERIMKCCHSMTVTFSLISNDREGVFRKTALAYNTLRDLAERNSIEYTVTELTTNHRTKSEALKVISEAVMLGEDLHTESTNGVVIAAADTPYDECVYVAREICKLAKSGVRLSEIAVCAANIASYASVLENVLHTYGVPHLTCSENSVVQMPVITLVLSALDVINSSFYSKNVKSYLKSPYLDLTEEEAYFLENYITLWNLKKKNWYSEDDWVYHPKGYVETFSSEDKHELEVVNRARKKVFTPLKKLAEGFSDRSTVREKAVALVEYFDSLGLSKKVEQYNKELGEAFGGVDYDDEICAWNSLLSALDMLVDGAGNLSVGRDRFIKYMRLILSDMSFGNIPSAIEEVELGDVEFVRNKNVKHMFFIGFNEGVFPAVDDPRSIFTESERKWLYENDLKLCDSQEDKLRDQTFQFLLALLRPSETLYLVYHTSSSDGSKAQALPSYFVNTVTEVTGIEAVNPEHFPPVSVNELREYMVSCGDDLSELLTDEKGIELYKQAQMLREFADRAQKPFHLDAEGNGDDQFYLTQSRLEKYEKCRFSYFVEYMLNVKVRRSAEFGSAEIGSYVHKILETVLKTIIESGKSITEIDQDEIKSLTENAAAEFIEKTARNINENSPKYKYLIDNICFFVLLLIDNIKEEFSASLFKPVYFEENLSKSEVVKPYEIELKSGGKLSLYGIIDRVDSYVDENGVEYIRVVDYKTKTGGKSFSLEDVLNGINLQMLIYLFAFTSTPTDHERREAGIMYMPAARDTLKATDVEVGDDVVRSNISKDLKRSGMYLDDRRIIDAMEIGDEKRFVNLKYDKNNDEYCSNAQSTLATLEEFGIIKRYIDMLFNDVIDNMKAGNIEASPIEEKNSGGSSCSYCPYHPICRFEGEPREKIKCEFPLLKMRQELGEVVE